VSVLGRRRLPRADGPRAMDLLARVDGDLCPCGGELWPAGEPEAVGRSVGCLNVCTSCGRLWRLVFRVREVGSRAERG
jgi:hypothetical protein